MATPLPVRCMVCRAEFDYWHRYGREGCACSRDCYKQFELRRARTIVGHAADGPPERKGR